MGLRIVSGGQTGVDRAALDVALDAGLPCGGWCPRGRRAEDGPLATRYPMRETATTDYACRTEWNVRDSDATLILTFGALDGGSALTAELAGRLDRPLLVVDLAKPAAPEVVRRFVADHGVTTLNVAGPRESRRPGIYERAVSYLREALAEK